MNHITKIIIISLATILVITIGILSFILSEPVEYYLTGKVTARAYITEATPEDCLVTLKTGKNYVSFYCETGRPIEEALHDNVTEFNYKATYRYNPLDPSNPWRINNPNLPEWVNQNLNEIRRHEGYVIIMNEQRTYNHTGFLSANNNIQLREGWNLVGYTLSVERNIENAMNSIQGQFTRVEEYDEETNTWKVYVPGEVNEISTLKPMKSYWIYAKEDVLWTLN